MAFACPIFSVLLVSWLSDDFIELRPAAAVKLEFRPLFKPLVFRVGFVEYG